MTGIVENLQRGHGFLRDAQTWRRYFFAAADCLDDLPPLNSHVEFEPDDDSDPRGPRARRVVLIGEPVATLDRTCSDCGDPFELDAGEQAWYAAKALALPTRCRQCRATRKHYSRSPRF